MLEEIRDFFGCGRIRPKGPNSRVLTFTVQRRQDLLEIVIPFFEQHPLLVKSADFTSFAEITRSLERGDHFTWKGFDRLVRRAYSMNLSGKQRARPIEEVLNGSSETVRQARADSSVR